MSDRQHLFDVKSSKQTSPSDKITDEMALDYAIFLYNLYRKAKLNYN